MSIKLPSLLLRHRSETLEDLPKETFIDIMAQNLFLRCLALLMGVCLLGSWLTLAWQLKKRTQVIYIHQPDNATYTDEPVAVDSKTALSTSSAASASMMRDDQAQPPPMDGDKVQSKTSESKALVFARRKRRGGASGVAAQSSGDPTTQQPVPDPGRTQQAEASAKAEPRADLWSLLDRLKSDQRKEILEESVLAGDVRIAFREAGPSGLISFDLTNQGDDPVLMPQVQVVGRRSRAYIERRVLEKDFKSAGILQVEDLKGGDKLRLIFSAANAKALNLVLEVPRW